MWQHLNDNHDPWNEPTHRHPRAQQLMAEELWNCADEDAPFGSDEGADAFEEYRAWRAENPKVPLTEFIEWIGDDSNWDEFTFDATIIATVLGQLVWEGHIEANAKVFARTAIERQMKDASEHRRSLLANALNAIDAG